MVIQKQCIERVQKQLLSLPTNVQMSYLHACSPSHLDKSTLSYLLRQDRSYRIFHAVLKNSKLENGVAIAVGAVTVVLQLDSVMVLYCCSRDH
jgi:hypothetical protein